MAYSPRRLNCSLLAAYFVAATVVGEAWHLLPGNDFEGRLALSRTAAGFREFGADWGGGVPSASASLPVPLPPTTDFCPICQFLGKARVPAPPAVPPPAPPLAELLPLLVPPSTWSPIVATRGIRGPPQLAVCFPDSRA